MSETIITWNWQNWITVGLMAGLMFALVGFGLRLYQSQTTGG